MIWHGPCIEIFLMCQEATIRSARETVPAKLLSASSIAPTAHPYSPSLCFGRFFCQKCFCQTGRGQTRNYLSFISSHLQQFERIITAETRRFLQIINVNTIRKRLSLLYLTANTIFIRAFPYIWKAQLNNSRRQTTHQSMNRPLHRSVGVLACGVVRHLAASETARFPAPRSRPNLTNLDP